MDQTAPTLSLAEHQALEELDAYGFDFAPAYIGRARRHFAERRTQPTTAQILDQVFVLAAADDAAPQRLSISIQDARNYTRLRAIDWEQTGQLAALLRESLALERAKHSNPDALAGLGAKTRLCLYPDKIAAPGQDQPFSAARKINGKSLAFKAWVGKNTDFVNLEISVL